MSDDDTGTMDGVYEREKKTGGFGDFPCLSFSILLVGGMVLTIMGALCYSDEASKDFCGKDVNLGAEAMTLTGVAMLISAIFGALQAIFPDLVRSALVVFLYPRAQQAITLFVVTVSIVLIGLGIPCMQSTRYPPKYADWDKYCPHVVGHANSRAGKFMTGIGVAAIIIQLSVYACAYTFLSRSMTFNQKFWIFLRVVGQYLMIAVPAMIMAYGFACNVNVDFCTSNTDWQYGSILTDTERGMIHLGTGAALFWVGGAFSLSVFLFYKQRDLIQKFTERFMDRTPDDIDLERNEREQEARERALAAPTSRPMTEAEEWAMQNNFASEKSMSEVLRAMEITCLDGTVSVAERDMLNDMCEEHNVNDWQKYLLSQSCQKTLNPQHRNMPLVYGKPARPSRWTEEQKLQAAWAGKPGATADNLRTLKSTLNVCLVDGSFSADEKNAVEDMIRTFGVNPWQLYWATKQAAKANKWDKPLPYPKPGFPPGYTSPRFAVDVGPTFVPPPRRRELQPPKGMSFGSLFGVCLAFVAIGVGGMLLSFFGERCIHEHYFCGPAGWEAGGEAMLSIGPMLLLLLFAFPVSTVILRHYKPKGQKQFQLTKPSTRFKYWMRTYAGLVYVVGAGLLVGFGSTCVHRVKESWECASLNNSVTGLTAPGVGLTNTECQLLEKGYSNDIEMSVAPTQYPTPAPGVFSPQIVPVAGFTGRRLIPDARYAGNVEMSFRIQLQLFTGSAAAGYTCLGDTALNDIIDTFNNNTLAQNPRLVLMEEVAVTMNKALKAVYADFAEMSCKQNLVEPQKFDCCYNWEDPFALANVGNASFRELDCKGKTSLVPDTPGVFFTNKDEEILHSERRLAGDKACPKVLGFTIKQSVGEFAFADSEQLEKALNYAQEWEKLGTRIVTRMQALSAASARSRRLAAGINTMDTVTAAKGTVKYESFGPQLTPTPFPTAAPTFSYHSPKQALFGAKQKPGNSWYNAGNGDPLGVRWRFKYTGGNNTNYQGCSKPGHLTCGCCRQKAKVWPKPVYSSDKHLVIWKFSMKNIYPYVPTYCGLFSDETTHVSGLIGERFGRSMIAIGCLMVLLLLPLGVLWFQRYFMNGQAFRDASINTNSRGELKEGEGLGPTRFKGTGFWYWQTLLVVLVAVLAAIMLGLGSTCVHRYELVRQDKLREGSAIDTSGRTTQKWAAGQSEFWRTEQYCGPTGEYGGWVMVVLGVLILELFFAAYLCDDVLRDPEFDAKRTQMKMDRCCGAKIGAVMRVWGAVILGTGLVAAPAIIFGLGVACWDRGVEHCGSNTKTGGIIMTCVGGIIVELFGGFVFASKQLFDGDGTALPADAAHQSVTSFNADRLAASPTARSIQSRSQGHSKLCYFLIGLLKFALLSGGVACIVFGILCDEDQNRFCGFGEGGKNSAMIAFGSLITFVVLVDLYTAGRDRAGGVMGIVGLVGIGFVIAAPIFIGLGAACVNGDDEYCGTGGRDGGKAMIVLGIVFAAWAASFLVARSLNKQSADTGVNDVGTNFFMSIIVFFIAVILFAPIALAGVGIKCLTDPGREGNPSDWCLWADTKDEFRDVGIALTVIGVVLFLLEWLIIVYCRPRDDPIPPAAPSTPPFPEAVTPPLYENEPPPQEYKRLGPFLAWSRWVEGPSTGGPQDSGAGHVRVDNGSRPGHWGSPPKSAPVALSGVESALGFGELDRDSHVTGNLTKVSSKLSQWKGR